MIINNVLILLVGIAIAVILFKIRVTQVVNEIKLLIINRPEGVLVKKVNSLTTVQEFVDSKADILISVTTESDYWIELGYPAPVFTNYLITLPHGIPFFARLFKKTCLKQVKRLLLLRGIQMNSILIKDNDELHAL